MAVDPARAKSLFLNASDLTDPAERDAYLARECGSDAALRGRVEALLSANDDSPIPSPANDAETIDTGDGPGATGLHTPRPDGGPAPQSIGFELRSDAKPDVLIAGRYTLQEKIGEGGMGEVWVAKQSEPVKRKVALKLIKTGMDSRAVLQRFELERQALAMMDHPNIAKVLDAGLTPSGQPFFAMELVNGLPLNRFCDEARLTTNDRLELFVSICNAVQHAHQKGIVHRDLKPANILVTIIDGKPVPKVIDFGVAKATSGKLTDDSLSTQFGAIVGTLEYMSPEQAGFSGEDIDTRSDIYSLGVILYELLTGLRPIDANRLKKAALTEMIRIIREEDPSKPSTRLSTDESLASMAAVRQIDPRRLMSLLRGELDWVVMKCLEKRRDRRYETASGLARDVQRYLADEAVEARPPSAGYRFRKFLRRNKGPVLAASAVALAIVAGVAGVVAVQARANRELAGKNAELADANRQIEARFELAQDAIKTFHAGVSEDILLKEKAFVGLRKKLLAGARDFYARLEQLLQGRDDRKSRSALARTYLSLAELTREIESTETALEIFRKSLDLRRTLAQEPGAGPDAQAEIAECLRGLCQCLADSKRHAEAKAAVAEAKDLLAGLVRVHPDVERYRADLAKTLKVYGAISWLAGSYDDAQAADQQSEDIYRALAEAHPDDASFKEGIIAALTGKAIVMYSQGRSGDAIPIYQRILTVNGELAEADPGDAKRRDNLAKAYVNLGMAVGDARPDEALAQFRPALVLWEKLVADYPNSLSYQNNLGFVLDRMANSLGGSGRTAEELPLVERKRDVFLGAAQADPSNPRFADEAADCCEGISELHALEGRPAEALAARVQAVTIREELEKRHPGFGTSRLAGGYRTLGVLQREAGRGAEAEAAFEKARTAWRKAVETDSAKPASRAAAGANVLGLVLALHDLGRPAEAAKPLREFLASTREAMPGDDPEFAGLLIEFGFGLLQAKAYVEAEPLLRECLAIREKAQPDGWKTFNTMSMLGGSLLGQRKYADAEPLLIAGYEGMKRREATIPRAGRINLIAARERLGQLYEATHRPDQAARLGLTELPKDLFAK